MRPLRNAETNSQGRMLIAAALFVLAALRVSGAAAAEKMPAIGGQNLADRQVDFPSACSESGCVILIGFSRGSQSQVKAWMDRADSAAPQSPRVGIYSVAVLEDAPRFVRGMVVHGMKGSMPRAQRDRFVVVYQGEKELKRITGFRNADDAYLLLVTRNGEVAWTTHGPLTEAAFSELQSQILRLKGQ